jgi:protein SCO1/2
VGKDVFIYSLTLQPHIDRPEDLKAYAERYKTGPGWTFLTGKPAEMEILRKKLGFFDTDPVLDRDISRHSGVLRIGNERIDRWLMMPALAKARQIVYEINNLPA